MAITKIQSESLNLADTYAFTGTVTGAGGVNTPAFMAYRNSTLSISHATWTVIVYDTEVFDSNSGFDTSTGIYTVPSNGKYYFQYQIRSTADADTNSVRIFTTGEKISGGTTTNWGGATLDWRANYARAGSVGSSAILDCNANDQIKNAIYHQTVNSGNVSVEVGSSMHTYFLGYKIIE